MEKQSELKQRITRIMGQRLKALRLHARLTQVTVAEAFDREQQEVSHWESGAYAIPSYLLPGLTHLLQVPLETLYDPAMLYQPSTLPTTPDLAWILSAVSGGLTAADQRELLRYLQGLPP